MPQRDNPSEAVPATMRGKPPRRLARQATKLIAEALTEQYPGVEAFPHGSGPVEAGRQLRAADVVDLETVLHRRVLRARDRRRDDDSAD